MHQATQNEQGRQTHDQFTVKLYWPLVLCPSTETTCQLTLYLPALSSPSIDTLTGVVVRIELQLAGFHHGVVRAGDFHAAEVRLDAFGEAEGQRFRRRADAGVGLRRLHFQMGVRQRLLRRQADEQDKTVVSRRQEERILPITVVSLNSIKRVIRVKATAKAMYQRPQPTANDCATGKQKNGLYRLTRCFDSTIPVAYRGKS